MEDGVGWRVDGGLRMEDEGWRVEGGGWRVGGGWEDGGWVEDDDASLIYAGCCDRRKHVVCAAGVPFALNECHACSRHRHCAAGDRSRGRCSAADLGNDITQGVECGLHLGFGACCVAQVS